MADNKKDFVYEKFADKLKELINELTDKDKYTQAWNNNVPAGILLGPKNLRGTPYKGGNQMLLLFDTFKNSYKAPVYMTYPQAKGEGASIKANEKAIPVIHANVSYRNNETKEYIREKDYNELPDEEKEKYRKVLSSITYANVFNIDQSNLREVKPELYDKLIEPYQASRSEEMQLDDSNLYSNEAVDKMVSENQWVAKIQANQQSDSAYYSPSLDIIVIPQKQQFDKGGDGVAEGQRYYNTLFHEMAHSTGAKERLNRDLSGRFGSPAYAREEVVAETSAAFVGAAMGFKPEVMKESLVYLKGWLENAEGNAKDLNYAMGDVSKATEQIFGAINKQLIELNKEQLNASKVTIPSEINLEETKDLPNQVNENITIFRGQHSDNLQDKKSSLDNTLLYKYIKQFDVYPDKAESIYNDYFQHDLPYKKYNLASPSEIERIAVDNFSSLSSFNGFLFAKAAAGVRADGLDKFLNQFNARRGGNEIEKYEEMRERNISNIRDAFLSEVKADPILSEYPPVSGEAKEYISSFNEKIGGVPEEDTERLSKLPRKHIDGYLSIYKEIDDQLKKDPFINTEPYQSKIETFITENKMKGKTLYDLQAQYSRMNAQYPASVDNDRTRQLAKRIRQAEQIISTYNSNVAAAYGDNFLFSEKAMTTIIPHAIYSGREQPTLTPQEQRVESASENKEREEAQEKATPSLQPAPTQEDTTKANYREISASSGYEPELHDEWDISKGEDPDRNGLFSDPENDADYFDAWDETLQKWSQEESSENVSLSEDSNPQTDLAGVAEHIMETNHVSKEAAEKMAAPIVNEQQTAVKEKEVKQEVIKKAAEVRKSEEERKKLTEEQAEKKKYRDLQVAEAERRSEEARKKDDKKDIAFWKIVLSSTLLVGALEASKKNGGVWLNKSGKSNVEFLADKTPISPYNSLVMSLNSDDKGYRTNVYVASGRNRGDGNAIKRGEESLPFNWVQWEHEDKQTGQRISSKDYHALPKEEQGNYRTVQNRVTNRVFNVDQTLMSVHNKEEYKKLLSDRGERIEELGEAKHNSPILQEKYMRQKFPGTINIFRKDENTFEAYNQSAGKLIKELNLMRQTEKSDTGKTITKVSFTEDRLLPYLSKLVEKGNRVSVVDNPDSISLIKAMPNESQAWRRASEIARAYSKSSGVGYEIINTLEPASYSASEDKIKVPIQNYSPELTKRNATVEKINDLYRAIIASTGTKDRLDVSSRTGLLPQDDEKYQKLIQEIGAGILMVRQGLPAAISKENRSLVPYWQNELRANNKQLIGMIERDVNNAVEVVDNLVNNKKVNYADILSKGNPKTIYDPQDYSVISKLSVYPNTESKEFIVIKDKNHHADVVLPEGASEEKGKEISGMRKDRIEVVLKKEGVTDISFYNAGGFKSLMQKNDFFADKQVSIERLKQYELVDHRDINLSDEIKRSKQPTIEKFLVLRDKAGEQYFYIKPLDEKGFSVKADKADINNFFNVKNSPNQDIARNILAQNYYKLANQNPGRKVELIVPSIPENVDMSRMERATITKDKDTGKKYVIATIDGNVERQEISNQQWNNMWLDTSRMQEYKNALAANIFANKLERTEIKEEVLDESNRPAREISNPEISIEAEKRLLSGNVLTTAEERDRIEHPEKYESKEQTRQTENRSRGRS